METSRPYVPAQPGWAPRIWPTNISSSTSSRHQAAARHSRAAFQWKTTGIKPKDTEQPNCSSSPWRFCLPIHLKAFCIYINRVEKGAEHWSVSSGGIRGQHQTNKSCVCLSYQKADAPSPVETIYLRGHGAVIQTSQLSSTSSQKAVVQLWLQLLS